VPLFERDEVIRLLLGDVDDLDRHEPFGGRAVSRRF
jgi:hypothetical protein